MKIQLLSDLHVECWNKRPEVVYQTMLTNADVLVLAGDINVGRKNTAATLNWFAEHYKHVVYVQGNHEEYGSHFGAFREYPYFVAKLADNVHFLDDKGFVVIDGVPFFGGCLYTNFGNDPLAEQMAQHFITDFKRVSGAFTHLYAAQRDADLEVIKHAYNTFNKDHYKNLVIVTHFLPAMECIDNKFLRGDGTELALNKYFANNLGEYISTLREGTVWMFGHTHESVDKMIGDTRMLCNPYGYMYYETNKNFNPHMVIEL